MWGQLLRFLRLLVYLEWPVADACANEMQNSLNKYQRRIVLIYLFGALVGVIIITLESVGKDLRQKLKSCGEIKLELDIVTIPNDEDWGTAESLRHIRDKIKVTQLLWPQFAQRHSKCDPASQNQQKVTQPHCVLWFKKGTLSEHGWFLVFDIFWKNNPSM